MKRKIFMLAALIVGFSVVNATVADATKRGRAREERRRNERWDNDIETRRERDIRQPIVNDRSINARRARSSGGTVYVGNHAIFVLRDYASGMSPSSRARRAADVINRQLRRERRWKTKDVYVTNRYGDPWVMMGGDRVVMVCSADARRAGMKRSSLADRWARNLRNVLPRSNRR